jgi:hypothetical protein
MSCHIRPFRDDDGPHLVEILKRNNQLAFPDVDGLDAMLWLGATPPYSWWLSCRILDLI